MPILNRNPVAIPPDVPNQLPGTAQVPSGSIFTAIDPVGTRPAFSKYVEGYPMSVNYYGQLLGDHNSVANFDPATPDLTQPLYKINDMVIQLTSPIEGTYNGNDGLTRVVGAAIFPLGLIPNVGDTFIAKIENGDDGVFQLTTVNRKTHRRETLYEADFVLLYYLSTDPSVLTRLDQRVNDEYYFNKDTNFFNRDVLITPMVKEANDRLNEFIFASQRYYVNKFYQRHTGGFYLPEVIPRMYDVNLMKFIAKTVDFTGAGLYRITMPDTSFEETFDNLSIFDLVQTRNKLLVPVVEKNWAFFSSRLIKGDARYGALRFSGIEFITMPGVLTTNPPTVDGVDPNEVGAMPPYNPLARLRDGLEVATFPTLIGQSSYVVSEEFYKKLANLPASLTYFEYVLLKFVLREAVAKVDLATMIRDWTSWTPLQQFYFLPLFWFMTKNT